MEKYKSFYPTLRQAKTKWSKPSIVAKQGEGPSHGWYEMMKKDARSKLAASIHQSKFGSVTRQQKIVHEETDDQHIYHVTHTKHVDKIRKSGIMPMKTSNWVKAGDKERYGGGEVYAFTHKADAHAWAGRMDWAHHQKLGSGKISIITAKRPSDRKFEVDTNDPLSQAGKKGDWLKTHGSIEPHHIVSVEPYHPKKLGEDKVAVFHHETQLQNVRMKETGVKRKKRMKDPRPTDFSRPDLKEAKDKIGKQTPSAETIAKKHNKEVAEIQAQIDKGIKVEREHTNSDAEAHEIARDHLDEFPDYYDRLDKMEKKAKKDMKEAVKVKRTPRKKQSRMSWQAYARKINKDDPKAVRKALIAHSKLTEGYDPDVEQIRNTIDAHKKVAEKMAKQHGEQSQEAAFHRAYVKHLTRQLKAVHGLDEEVANSVGGGMSPVVGGEGNIHGIDPIMGKPVRRKKFAGKQVFVVDPTTYHKAYLGKRKYEHYEKYLEGSPMADEIREYGRKYWDEPIIIENEQTGAMVYLKYGSK